jgi:hypothetical protein
MERLSANVIRTQVLTVGYDDFAGATRRTRRHAETCGSQWPPFWPLPGGGNRSWLKGDEIAPTLRIEATVPSEEPPPPGVRKTTLWLLATCVLRDHAEASTGRFVVCLGCYQPWPCGCRTLAERVLDEAKRRPRPRPVRNQAYLDLLRSRMTERPTDDP